MRPRVYWEEDHYRPDYETPINEETDPYGGGWNAWDDLTAREQGNLPGLS